MRASQWCLLFLCFFCFVTLSDGQTLTLDQLVKAWSVSDTSQSRVAAMVDSDLSTHFDQDVFLERMRELEGYLGRHPDRRL